MSKKKVLFVATVVKTHINVFHLPYLKWFQEKGYETHVAAKNDFDKEECAIPYCNVYHNISFERKPIKKANIEAYRQLKKIIQENKYDIIHCHTPVGAMIARLAAREARKKGTKVIYTAHGFHFYKGAPLLNWLIYYPVEWICSFLTDILITINKEDYILAQDKMKTKEIYYIPGIGIDINKFDNVNIDTEQKRKQFNIDTDALVLLSVGELNRNKNHEIIIKALTKIQEENIHYCIAGQGELEQYLKDLVESLGISKKVHFLGFRKDIDEIYKICDIFCFPSYREGLSVALMEAMASGLPIICSNIRGNTDLVKEGQGGYLFNPSSVNEVTDRLEKMLEHKEILESMGAYNKQSIRKFDASFIIEKMKKIYNI